MCVCVCVCVHGLMDTAIGNGYGYTSSNPGRSSSHSTYTLGKSMNTIILPAAMYE